MGLSDALRSLGLRLKAESYQALADVEETPTMALATKGDHQTSLPLDVCFPC